MTANDHDTAHPVPHDLPLGTFGITVPMTGEDY